MLGYRIALQLLERHHRPYQHIDDGRHHVRAAQRECQHSLFNMPLVDLRRIPQRIYRYRQYRPQIGGLGAFDKFREISVIHGQHHIHVHGEPLIAMQGHGQATDQYVVDICTVQRRQKLVHVHAGSVPSLIKTRIGRFSPKNVDLPHAPVAQLDRVLPSEGRGRTFESSRARQVQIPVVWQGSP